MLFKMTLPIRKKTDDLDMPGLTTLTRKQKGSELLLFFLHIREGIKTGRPSAQTSELSANLLFYWVRFCEVKENVITGKWKRTTENYSNENIARAESVLVIICRKSLKAREVFGRCMSAVTRNGGLVLTRKWIISALYAVYRWIQSRNLIILVD